MVLSKWELPASDLCVSLPPTSCDRTWRSRSPFGPGQRSLVSTLKIVWLTAVIVDLSATLTMTMSLSGVNPNLFRGGGDFYWVDSRIQIKKILSPRYFYWGEGSPRMDTTDEPSITQAVFLHDLSRWCLVQKLATWLPTFDTNFWYQLNCYIYCQKNIRTVNQSNLVFVNCRLNKVLTGASRE